MTPKHTEAGDHVLRWQSEQQPIELLLTPERAVVWPSRRTVFIADVHIGKAAVFRARGLPVPQGTTSATLARLSRVIERTQAQQLVVLGDFLHARESQASGTMQALHTWRKRHSDVGCLVIQGNHDRHAGALDSSLGIVTQSEPFWTPGLIGVHEAHEALQEIGDTANALILAGHEHPVVSLRDRLDQLRLPCYRLRQNVLTLPAFGDFTGGHETRESGDRLFVIADRVFAL